MVTNQPISFEKQEHIIQTCINEQVSLNEVLSSYGLTYEQLRYRHNKIIPRSQIPYQTVSDEPFAYHGMPSISFFSGSGGLDLGFEQAGFKHLASFEINEIFCQTLRKNRPSWKVFGPPDASGDIRNREDIIDTLTNQVGVSIPFEGVFHGGPPCQPFSIASNQRFAKWGDNFKRTGYNHAENGNLLLDYVWFIEMFRPAAFLIENVSGLMTIDGGRQLSMIIKSLQLAGYEVAKPVFLNAKYYNVPQTRERLFIVGWRNIRKNFQVPVENLLEIPCHKAFEKPVQDLPNHITRKHKAESILRYMALQYGQRDKLGRVDRLNPMLPAKTVIAGGMGGGGRSHLHPFIPRTLSPRETARLQTFPDDYEFCGSPARQLTQIGNAVPPVMTQKIAIAIYESIFK